MDSKARIFAGLLGGLAIILIGAGCGPAAPDTKAPAPPTLTTDVSAPVNSETITLTGGKEKGTAIIINGTKLIELSDALDWSYDLTLREGNNPLFIVAEDKGGNQSDPLKANIIYVIPVTPPDTTAPVAPTLNAVTSPTKQATQVLSGAKEANSSVWINGAQAVPIDVNETWSHTMALTEGDNNLTLSSKDKAGNESAVTSGLIVRDSTPPAAPTLNTVSSPTKTTPQIISGGKAANSSVYLNGTEVVALDSSTTWTYSLALIAGDNAISLTSRDALGNESQAVAGLIAYDATAPFTPVVNAVTSPTNLSFQSISGTKEANSSILIDGKEQVSLNGSTTWVATVSLSEGTNTFAITSRDAAGNTSAAASATIVRDSTVAADAPAAPVLNAVTTPTSLTTQNISGTKPANTSIRLNGKTIVPLDASTTWLYNNLALIEGNNNLMFTARNAAGVDSEVTTGLIVRDTVKPASPSLNAVVTPTNTPSQTISGSKEANTSVRLNGTEIVAMNANTIWSSSMPLVGGSNAISLVARDAALNDSDATTSAIFYDITVPADPTVNAVVSPTNVNSQVLSGTKEANSSIWFGGSERVPVNSSTTWSYTVSLVIGANNFTITSKDAAGNPSAGSASASITLDTTAPAAPGLTAVISPTNSTTQTISGTKEANTSIRLNGVEIVALDGNPTWSKTNLPLIEGNNSLSLTSKDAAGNESGSTTGLIVRDTIKPSSPSLSAVTTPTNVNPQTISGTKEANTSVKLGASEIVALNVNTTWTYNMPLVAGANAISLTSVDAAANESGATTSSIFYDITVPADPTVNAVVSPTNVNSQLLTGGKEANSSIWINAVERVPVNSDTTWSYTVSLSGGSNSFTMRSKDAAGNINTNSVTVSITLDTTAPAAPGLTAVTSPTNSTTQTISGTKEASTSVRLNGVEIVALDGNTTWTKTNLPLIEGNNSLSLTSKDAAGNESTATTGLIIRDTIKPSSPSLSAVTTPTNVTPQTISGTKEANTSVKLGATEIVALNVNTTWTYNMPLSFGANAISLTSVDAAANESGATTSSITYDNVVPADPTVNAQVTPTNVNSQVLTGTKEANSSILIGGVERVPVNSSTSWSYTVSLSGGINSFAITSKDAAGNTSTGSASASITLDTTAPAAPGLTAVTSPTNSTTQTISGTKEANTSIRLNGVEIVALDGNTTWTKTNLPLIEGNNSLSLTSKDAAGNESPATTGLIVRDTAAPSTPTLYPASITSPTQAIWLTLSGTKEANSSIWAQIGAGSDTERIAVNANTTWNWPTLLSSEGQNTFTITSRDAAGNISSQNVIAIVRDRTLPVGLTVDAVISPTNQEYQTITGSKEANTSVWVNGVQRVDLDSNITWSYVLPLYEGTNNISVTLKDAAGNQCAPVLRTISCDTIAPANPTLNPVTTPTRIATQNISGTKEADSSIWLNSSEIVTVNVSTNWNRTISLVEGNNPLYLSSRDAAGNESGEVFGFIVLDSIKPVAPVLISGITSPTRTTPQMLIGIKESGSSVMINGKVQITYSEATTWVYRMPLTEGPNPITATSWDAAKNESSAAGPYSITLDTAAPTAPHLSTVTTPTNEQIQFVSGYKDSGASVWLNGIEVVPANFATTWSYGLFLVEGSNTIYSISSRDAAGNQIAGTGVPQSILLDTVPPEAPRLIYPLDHHMTRDGGSIFEWNPVYYPDGSTAYNFQATIVFNNTSDFNVPLVDATVYEPWFGWGGLGSGQFAWRARARDAAGNWGPFSSSRDMWFQRAPGDMSGNNMDDIIVGATDYWDGAYHSGRAYVYENSTVTMGMTTCSINNPNTVYGGDGDWFGKSVAMVGDLDGNQRAEMAIGSPYATQKLSWTYYPQAGSAFIVNYGSAGCYISRQLMSPTGPQNDEYFGSSVAGIGDINGDGYADMIVGASGWDGGGFGPNNGRVLIYLGRETLLGTPDIIINGVEKGGQFGNAASGIGDFDDDGYDDFIVGANLYGTAVGRQDGRAYIFFGDSNTGNIGWSHSITLELPAGFKDLAGNKNDRFGEAVAGGGDYNKDGYADAIIGAPFAAPNKIQSGMVMVAYGPDAHTWTILDERFLGVTRGNGWFGYSVGSVTGDNTTGDVLVGSPNADWHSPVDGFKEGYVSLFDGSISGVNKHGTIIGRGQNDGNQYGNFVSTAGDINRDGQEDYLAGAPYYSGGAGMVEIIYKGGSPSYYLGNPTPNPDNFGWSVGGGGGAGK